MDTWVAGLKQDHAWRWEGAFWYAPKEAVFRVAARLRMTGADPNFLPFHQDELAAQQLAGERSKLASIRTFMPEQHRDFFALLPYLFVATADSQGWPVASVLTGDAGFVHAPDPTTLRIDALPPVDDPTVAGIGIDREIGLLGLDFSTRRRNRANGRLSALDDGGLTVRISQSFGNCAQYIQTRRPAPRLIEPVQVQAFDALDDEARRLITGVDTFFVASRSRSDIGALGGLDMSHRGGRPSFVEVGADTLAIPDFRGNRFFNTLGNLLGDSRAGLLFIDFATGDLLQVQGIVTIDWIGADAARFAGAQRTWSVKIKRGWWRRKAFPFSWTFGEYAPTTLATGLWRPAATG
jgi:predicted pyridoxine 5'-phosphate oxidase superfamily flavin-nucleotide-binding protein